MNGETQSDWCDEAAATVHEAERKYLSKTAPNPEGPYSTRPDLPLTIFKELVKTFRANHWDVGPLAALDYVTKACRGGQRNQMLFSILFLTTFKHDLPEKTWFYLENWIDYIKDWDVGDQLAINIAGRLAAGDKSRLKEIQQWPQSEKPMLRRFAVITMSRLMQKGGCKPKDVLKLLDSLMRDEDQHVQTAVAFAIRHIEQIDEPRCVAFLKKWKGKANHEIFRESLSALSPQAKMSLIKAKSHHA